MQVKLYKYHGHDWPQLKEKPFYTFREVTEITGLSDTTLRNRIRNTDIIYDHNLYSAKRGPIKLKYVGKKSGMRTGKFYTMKYFANVAGIACATMHTRLRNKTEVTDYMLRPADERYIAEHKMSAWPIFEKEIERVSQSWLCKRII